MTILHWLNHAPSAKEVPAKVSAFGLSEQATGIMVKQSPRTEQTVGGMTGG
jgi:hypothetical protein